MKFFVGAIADYMQAIELQSDYALALRFAKKNVKAALENLQRAIDLDADSREQARTNAAFDTIRQDRQF